MLTPEESRVLTYLRRCATATVEDIRRRCLPGSSPEWATRILSNLDWSGHVILYHDRNGTPRDVQITLTGLNA
jgi:hypothetical protein